MALKLDLKNCEIFLNKVEFGKFKDRVLLASEKLLEKNTKSGEFTKWHDLPVNYDRAQLEKIKKCAKDIISKCDVLLVIGIGGSYLGAKSAIDFLKGQFYNEKQKSTPDIYFAGNNMSGDYINEIIELIGDRDFCINVISKSGTTIEPAIAFRIFKEILVKKYGKDQANSRIYVTTDKEKGALRQMSREQELTGFCILDDIGGRYSVLTAVGLLPMAVSGIDVDEVLNGAGAAYNDFLNKEFDNNICFKYAAVRNYFYNFGKTIEIFVSFEPRLFYFGEWLKQLFAESEGKEQKGIFPVYSTFTTDLHSIGQYIQEGIKNQFETIIWIDKPNTDIIIKNEENDTDGLNFLSGESVDFVNKQACLGAAMAHRDGGVPNMFISLDKADEYNLGYLIYFFLKSCAISGYVLGINPFDQPGVEQYKQNMFALLSKPGFEKPKD